MRLFAFIVMITFIVLLSVPHTGISQSDLKDDQSYEVIPDEAIRLRILANSERSTDQDLKHRVRDAVNAQITGWVEQLTDIEAARTLIEQRIPEIRSTVAEVLQEEGSQQDYDVSYGENVTFPVKLYGSYIYPAGEYEAVLITLGEGEGSNWWCVLFPPLCFLDFSNGTTTAEAPDNNNSDEHVSAAGDQENEESQEDEVEVKFFLFEWLGWS